MVLELEGCRIRYPGAGEWFRYPDLGLAAGSCLALMGRTGSGKTTLLNALFGYSFPGIMAYRRARLLGRDLRAWGKDRYGAISYMPQFVQSGLNPTLTVGQQLRLTGGGGIEEERLPDFLRELDLAETVEQLYPFQISGGMKQRLALMMGFLKAPRLFVLDEPSAALDHITLGQTLRFLRARKDEGCALVVVSHHRGFIKGIADQAVWLGKVSGHGGPLAGRETDQNIPGAGDSEKSFG